MMCGCCPQNVKRKEGIQINERRKKISNRGMKLNIEFNETN